VTERKRERERFHRGNDLSIAHDKLYTSQVFKVSIYIVHDTKLSHNFI